MENEPLPPPLDYDHMALRNLTALDGGTLPLVLQLRTWGGENNGWLEEGVASGGEEKGGRRRGSLILPHSLVSPCSVLGGQLCSMCVLGLFKPSGPQESTGFTSQCHHKGLIQGMSFTFTCTMRDEIWRWIWRRCDLSMEGLSDSGYGDVPIGPEGTHWISFLGPWGYRGGLRTTQASSVDQSALWPVSLWSLKFVRPHVFLNCKTMTGGLWRDIFSNKYLLGENLVANIRQKVKPIFFTRRLEVQSGLTDCREHSVLGPLKRFHPHRFFCLFHLHLHHLCLLQTVILRRDAPHHWLQTRNLVTRFHLIYSTLYWLLPLSDLTELPCSSPWHSLTIPSFLLASIPPRPSSGSFLSTISTPL